MIKLFVVEVQHMPEEVVVELCEEFDPDIEAIIITLLRVGDAVAQLELPLGGKSTSVEGLHKVGELSGVPLVNIIEVLRLDKHILKSGGYHSNVVVLSNLLGDEVVEALLLKHRDDLRHDSTQREDWRVIRTRCLYSCNFLVHSGYMHVQSNIFGFGK